MYPLLLVALWTCLLHDQRSAAVLYSDDIRLDDNVRGGGVGDPYGDLLTGRGGPVAHLPPLLSDDELRRILLTREILDDPLRRDGDDGDDDDSQLFNFPELKADQRDFAVNPSFRSFYDPRFRSLEGIGGKRADGPTESADEETGGGELADDRAGAKGVADNDNNNDADNADADADAITSSRIDDSTKSTDYKKAVDDPAAMTGPVAQHKIDESKISDLYFTTIVAVSSALAVFAIIGAGFCYHRVRRNSKASEDVEYPAYGVTGPGGKETSPTAGTDRKLAQNAQMYHYQHQKQQMIAFDSANGSPDKRSGPGNGAGGAALSDCESDDDGEEGDYTVYECPGLAPTGEMEVHNPLFQEDPTPKANK